MAYLLIELLETVTRSSSNLKILDQYCCSILSQAGDEENLHGIWKSFHLMEVCKEIFHDIQKNLYIMEVGKELFHGIQKSSYIMEASKEFSHDIQRNFHTMEFREVTFHDIRINSYIMEAPLKSTLSQPSKYKRPAVILPA